MKDSRKRIKLDNRTKCSEIAPVLSSSPTLAYYLAHRRNAVSEVNLSEKEKAGLHRISVNGS